MSHYKVAHVDEIEGIDYREDTLHAAGPRTTSGSPPSGRTPGAARTSATGWCRSHDGGSRATRSSTSCSAAARASRSTARPSTRRRARSSSARPRPTATAFAEEAGTAVLAVGSTVGQAYHGGGWEVWAPFHPQYEAGEYEAVIESARETLEASGYAAPLYNLACCEALVGRTEDAIGHLRHRVREAAGPPRPREGGHRPRRAPRRAGVPGASRSLVGVLVSETAMQSQRLPADRGSRPPRPARGRSLVLDGLSVEVAAGSVTGLLGPSGSGKSTLIRSIVGVQIVESGEVTRARPARRLAGAPRRASATSRRRRRSTAT